MARSYVRKKRNRTKGSARGEKIRGVLGTILTSLVPFVFLYLGYYVTNKLQVYYYGPLIAVAAIMRFVGYSKVEEKEAYYPMALRVIEAILYCVAIIVFSKMFGYGTFNIVVSIIVSLLCVVGLSFILSDSFTSTAAEMRSWGLLVLIAGMIAVIELWLPSMVAKSFWHSLWIGPVFMLVIAAVCVLAFSTYRMGSHDEGYEAFIFLPILFLFSIIRMIGVIFSVVSFSFGMFWFTLLFIIFSLLGAALAFLLSFIPVAINESRHY